MTRVPNTNVEALLKDGAYKATIISFQEPTFMSIRSELRIRIDLKIHDVPEYHQKGFDFLIGYMSVIIMVYRARRHWINMEVDIKVATREINGRVYNTFRILWPLEGNNKDDNTGYPNGDRP